MPVREYVFRSGRTKSCGCIRGIRHGLSHLPEHGIWAGVLDRCTNPKGKYWSAYGGRGIGIDPRWLNFPTFLADVGRRPSPAYSLGRIDNDGDYAPGNVRWETAVQQSNNKRNNRFLTCGGKTLTVAQWGRETGIGRRTIAQRLRIGWSVEEALSLGISPVSRTRRSST